MNEIPDHPDTNPSNNQPFQRTNILNGLTIEGKTIAHPSSWLRKTDADPATFYENLARLYEHDPDLATEVIGHNVVYAQGASSTSLPGVLRFGIQPDIFFDLHPDENVIVPIGSGPLNYSQGGVSLAIFPANGVALRYALNEGDQWNGFIPRAPHTREGIEKILRELNDWYQTGQIANISAYQRSINSQQRLLEIINGTRNISQEEQEVLLGNFPVIYLVSELTLPQNPVISGALPYEVVALAKGIPTGEIKGIAPTQIPILLVPQDKIELVQAFMKGESIKKLPLIFPIEVLNDFPHYW